MLLWASKLQSGDALKVWLLMQGSDGTLRPILYKPHILWQELGIFIKKKIYVLKSNCHRWYQGIRNTWSSPFTQLFFRFMNFQNRIDSVLRGKWNIQEVWMVAWGRSTLQWANCLVDAWKQDHVNISLLPRPIKSVLSDRCMKWCGWLGNEATSGKELAVPPGVKKGKSCIFNEPTLSQFKSDCFPFPWLPQLSFYYLFPLKPDPKFIYIPVLPYKMIKRSMESRDTLWSTWPALNKSVG